MIIGIILASGFSKRMKKDKLLIEIGGIKMVERVIKEAKKSSLDDIILIYRREEVKDIGEKYNIKTIFNPKAHLGQGEGLKLGVSKAGKSSAYMFLVGDQPFINSKVIDRLIDEYRKNESSIIVPYYNGKRGMPTIFPSEFRDELLKIEGDKGGRDIIENNPSLINNVDIAEERLGVDIDDPTSLKNLTEGRTSCQVR